MRATPAAILTLLLLGCDGGGAASVELAIDLVTDRAPGSGFATIETSLARTAPEPQRWDPPAWDALVLGARVAEYRALPSGAEDTLVVRLLDADDGEVARAERLVSLDADRGVRVVLRAPRVEAGALATCVLADGRRQCWGSRSVLEEGARPMTLRRATAIDEAPVRDLCLGSLHEGCVARWDGTLECVQEVTDGEALRRSSVLEGIREIDCGGVFGLFHRCHLDDGDRLACSGADNVGQLGNGEAGGGVDQDAPTGVDGLPRASQLTVGAVHSCAVVDGAVWCWGQNSGAQVGDGTIEDRFSPVRLEGPEGVIQIDATGRHTCALTRAGALWCWGFNNDGVVDPAGGEMVTRPHLEDRVDDVVEVAAGNGFTCVRNRVGAVRCWGANASGQLGDGSTEPRTTPVSPPLPGPAVSLSAGFAVACAVVDDDGYRVFCWGSDERGTVTGEGAGNFPSPVEVPLPEPLYSSQ